MNLCIIIFLNGLFETFLVEFFKNNFSVNKLCLLAFGHHFTFF